MDAGGAVGWCAGGFSTDAVGFLDRPIPCCRLKNRRTPESVSVDALQPIGERRKVKRQRLWKLLVPLGIAAVIMTFVVCATSAFAEPPPEHCACPYTDPQCDCPPPPPSLVGAMEGTCDEIDDLLKVTGQSATDHALATGDSEVMDQSRGGVLLPAVYIDSGMRAAGMDYIVAQGTIDDVLTAMNSENATGSTAGAASRTETVGNHSTATVTSAPSARPSSATTSSCS